MRLPAQAARQLPDQSTTIRVDSSSTDDSRLRGALPFPDSRDEETAMRVDPAGAIRRARRRMIGRPMPWNAVGRPAPAANIRVI